MSSEESSEDYPIPSSSDNATSPASKSPSDLSNHSPPTPPQVFSKRRKLRKRQNTQERREGESSADDTGPAGQNGSDLEEIAAEDGISHAGAGSNSAAGGVGDTPQQVVNYDSTSSQGSLSSLEGSVSGGDSDSDDYSNSISGEHSSASDSHDEEDNNLEEQVDIDQDEHPEPLYEGSKKTRDEVVLEVLDLYVTNHWTKKSLAGVLKCLESTLPEKNQMPSTVYRLFQYLKSHTPSVEEIAHFYCASCLSAKENSTVPCQKCQICESGVFFEVPLKAQIKFFFECYGLAEVLEKFPLAHEESTLKEISDGGGFVKVKLQCTGKYDLTLLWNTGGVDLSESSHVKLWPVQAVICEVPYHLRSKFTFVVCVWVDKVKPKMNVYLKPFVKSLNDLWLNGVEWTHPQTQEAIVSKVVAPALSADAPATSDVLHIQGVTAIYGCNLCEQEADPVQATIKGKVKTIRRFTYKKEPAQLRTGERMQTQASHAKVTKQPCKGVKGRSVVSKIPLFDTASSVPIDYMHCVLLGVVLRITKLWFCVKSHNHGKDWYIGDRMKAANKFIAGSVKVPDFVGRVPRDINSLHQWKASELLTWLLYLSLPVLIFIEMPNYYVKHHMLLIQGVYILLKDRISDCDLVEAERFLNRYVEQVGSLYRKQDLVYNMHSLLHLPLCVRRWGPLFSTSAFRFEDFNGLLASMIHGTKHQAKELVNNLALARGICALKWKVTMAQTGALRDTVVLEKARPASRDEVMLLQGNNITDVTEVFNRCPYFGKTFTSRAYDEKFVRANSFVLLRSSPASRENLGQILCFFRANGDVFCIVEIFKVNHLGLFVNTSPSHPPCKIEHMVPIYSSGERQKLVCSLSSVWDKLIKAVDYFCRRPNKNEKKV